MAGHAQSSGAGAGLAAGGLEGSWGMSALLFAGTLCDDRLPMWRVSVCCMNHAD